MTASYWLYVDLFRDFFEWTPEEDDTARGERLAGCLREFATRGDLTDARVEEMGPLLGNLLSVRFGTDWDERLKNAGPEQIRHQTFLAVRDFFVALARRQPLLLVLEDVHWADSLSLDLISLLMEALTLAPILLLCVYRPEQEHKCWRLGSIAAQKCAGRHTEVALRELTPGQSRHLIEALLTIDDLPASVKNLILEKSRGNPFFVEEVVRSLIASGMVYPEGETWRARQGIEEMAVPESIQSVILTRVDRLEREAKQVLESASVIGRLFRRRLLAQMTRREDALAKALGELEDHALIYQERAVPEEEYSFKHVLTQETVYGSLLRRRRALFHQQVAEAMEALYQDGREEYYEQLAYHYERSAADEKAVEYLLKAGEKARRAYLNDAALGFFQRALVRLDASAAVPEPTARDGEADEPATGLGARTSNPAFRTARLEAHRGLGLIYHALGKEAEAAEHLRRAIAIGKETGGAPKDIVRLHYWLGYVLFWQGSIEEELKVAEQGLEMLREDRECVEAAMMNAHAGLAHGHLGHHDQAREFVARNVQLLPRVPYCEELRWAYSNVAMRYASEKQMAEALDWFQLLEDQARTNHDLKGEVEACQMRAGWVLQPSGDLVGAGVGYRRAYELVVRTGDSKLAANSLQAMGSAALVLGDLGAAFEHTRAALKTHDEVGASIFLAFAWAQMGVVALCQGNPQTALEAFRTAREVWRSAGSRAGSWTTSGLARAHLARGAPREAIHWLEETIAQQGVSGPALGGLEEAYANAPEFRDFCARYRAAHPEAATGPFAQWFLDPAEPSRLLNDDCRLMIDWRSIPNQQSAISNQQFDGWDWHDPFGDCRLDVGGGVEIHAANARDLFYINHSAPRLLQEVSGEFAVETVCLPVSQEQPAMGGMLLWKDKENFLRLERGTWGRYEVAFLGCLANNDVTFGRGRLTADRVYLRLERLGSRVSALCSTDGQNWFTVGHAEFPIADPLEAGLHAIGMLDRTIYPGAYPEGTAIRFERFDLWSKTAGS